MIRPGERRVVITGVGPVTPIGTGRDAFWSAAVRGQSGTSPLDRLPLGFPVESLRSRVVARVPVSFAGSDPRHLQLGRLAMRLAMSDAGIDSLAPYRSAVVVGTAVAATSEMESTYLGLWNGETVDDGPCEKPLLPLLAFQTMAHDLARACNCNGPVLTTATGCTAGIDAIGTAFSLVRACEADVVLTGAAEAPITPVVYAAFDVIGALTQQNDRPARASRPFDAERDGFVLGEGAACLVVEDLGHALARGARIYAEITGFASLSNGYHMTDLPADGAALAECIGRVLEDAALGATAVDHISAHGSSTPQNDLCETNAVKNALGAQARRVTMTSLKSMVGHALGASNAIEIAAGALTIARQFLLPTINLDRRGDGCDLDYVANTGRPARVRNLLKLSSGFSGIHSALAMAAL